jgi:phospholipase/carboxylesterase
MRSAMMVYADPHPPLEFETAARPQATVILLHGLGSSGRIFEPVARRLDLQALGAIRVVLPHAPMQPVLWAGGRRLAAWYDLRATNFIEREDEVGLRAGQAYYESLIRREIDRGIKPDRIVIGGFSQGCALSLMTGVRFGERLGGIFGMSGYLPLAPATESEQHQVNRQTPIFLAHGEQDSIVLPELAVAARDLLKKQGHEVSWHTYPIGHSICDAELDDLWIWLKKILNT